MLYEGRAFEDERVELDGNEFVDCRFVRCKLVFSGYEEVRFDRCRIVDSEWVFDGPATNTLLFLSEMSREFGLGGQQLVQDVFRSIEDGVVIKQTVESLPEPAVAGAL